MAAPRRRTGQAVAARNGASLETDLAIAHGRLADWFVVQNYPETRGQKVIGRGAPDFLAVCPARGLSVLFDAKSTQAKRWPVSLLAGHQFAALENFAKVGGIAGVYLRTAEGDAWLPWAVVRGPWREWWAIPGGPEVYLTVADGIAVTDCAWVEAACR